ncbi:hypothetical protein [Gordonia paraffinivorans]|uniref:hypothetical protein n=1 Tax=Gordonia paraffinivorans TaxID=175628 RepID=UPI003FCE5F35
MSTPSDITDDTTAGAGADPAAHTEPAETSSGVSTTAVAVDEKPAEAGTVTSDSADAAEPVKPKKNKDKSAKGSAKGKSSKKNKKGKKAAQPSRGPVVAAVVVAAVASVLAIVFGTLWATDGSDDELAALQAKLATEEEAEKVAGDYALNVSKVDYQNIDAWRQALETGVTQQLKEKMEIAVDVVAPLLTQMQYVSTAEKLAATVAHSDGNQYVVRVFVDMDSKSRQTPDGVTATASYTITLDKASGWTITDVGGIGAGLPGQPGN